MPTGIGAGISGVFDLTLNAANKGKNGIKGSISNDWVSGPETMSEDALKENRIDFVVVSSLSSSTSIFARS
jgi:hypothetical protein